MLDLQAPTIEGCVRVTSSADKLDLDLLRKRDAGEFTRFVRVHESFVLGLCQTLGLSPADRDDAAAEAFAIAYRGLENFRGDAELTTWLYRIAYRTAIKVRKRYPPRTAELPETADTALQGPVEIAAGREMNEAVWRAVSQLDGDQSAAVEMFYRRGMNIEQVAAVMEIPAGSVKTLLFRARERLRFLLRSCERI